MDGKCLALLLCPLLLASCIDREVARVPSDHATELTHHIPVSNYDKVDILFVIDDSLSMEAEQVSLQQNFYRFIDTLTTEDLKLPDLHLAVVSTDMGNGPGGTCTETNDHGRFQAAAQQGCTVTPPTGSFIIDIDDGAGGRTTNYPAGQELADTFACIARLGKNGCGFEQPLEAMYRALDGSNPENAGFLRDDALLAVVIITDEDDCSVANTEIFDRSQANENATSELGYYDSFRCWEFGVKCDPDEPRELGTKENCTQRTDSPYLYNVDRYVEFLTGLKADPKEIIVAGIIGASGPVRIGSKIGDKFELKKSCGEDPNDEHRGAVPATRIEYFLHQFHYTTTTSLCDEDLSEALTTVAGLVDQANGDPCLTGALYDTDPAEPGVQQNCSVTEVQQPNQDDEDQTVLAECDNLAMPPLASNKPCWVIAPNLQRCSDEQSQLAITIFRDDDYVPPGTELLVRCEGQ